MILAVQALALPDYAVIVLYLVGTLVLGVMIGRRVVTGEDFFLAGRRLPWWAIGMSLVATDIGGTDIIGVGGAAYTHGLAVANFECIGCVPAMIVGAFVFIPFLYRSGVYTIPEYLEKRYNASVRATLATCWLVFMACNLGIMLLASGKMMSQLFGWDLAICIWVTALLVGFYTYAGGLAAVVYTDTLQCALLIAGCTMVLIVGLVEVGGVEGLREGLKQADQRRAVAMAEAGVPAETIEREIRTEQRTQLILPVDTVSPFPWTGILFGLALILSPAYWIGNQAIVQRSLGARSEFEAKAAFVWGALLKTFIPIIIAVPGLIAVALYPDLKDGDLAFPRLVGDLLPVGIRGAFVAAFLAALMSSVDSYLNSASTIVSLDFYKRFWEPDAAPKRLLVVGRATTLILSAWAVAFAFSLAGMSEESGIYAIFQTLMAFFQGPALAVLLTGMLWRRATGKAALISLLSGIGVSVSLYALHQPAIRDRLGIQPLFQIQSPFLYFSIWAFLVTLVLLIVLSYCTKPEPADKTLILARWDGRIGQPPPTAKEIL